MREDYYGKDYHQIGELYRIQYVNRPAKGVLIRAFKNLNDAIITSMNSFYYFEIDDISDKVVLLEKLHLMNYLVIIGITLRYTDTIYFKYYIKIESIMFQNSIP